MSELYNSRDKKAKYHSYDAYYQAQPVPRGRLTVAESNADYWQLAYEKLASEHTKLLNILNPHQQEEFFRILDVTNETKKSNENI